MEEWRLEIRRQQLIKYIGHPFHIHINDYQTKNSDTELEEAKPRRCNDAEFIWIQF